MKITVSFNRFQQGPFTVKWNDYSACRGPKAVNLSEYVTHLIVDNATNIYKGILNFTFSNSAKMDEVGLPRRQECRWARFRG